METVSEVFLVGSLTLENVRESLRISELYCKYTANALQRKFSF